MLLFKLPEGNFYHVTRLLGRKKMRNARDRKTERQEDRETERQEDRETERQKDRQGTYIKG
jgi:hypothetical protein